MTTETLQCRADAGFSEWLAASGGSLAATTYQAGKLLLIGWNGHQLSFLPRHFERPMGLALHDGQLLLACYDRVMRFADDAVLAHHFDDARPGRYDALYLPRVSHHAAGLDVHDVALTDDAAWIVATRFSCLATLSERYSFVPRWRPRFVSDDTPEDRCHLNGVAMRDGKPAFVSCLAQSDTKEGWRSRRGDGGVLIDVASNEVVLHGLAMPHSPRWHDGALWALDSGRGRLLRIDAARGSADEVCVLPGYLRGLDFVGPYALIGLCQARETQHFGDLPIQAHAAQLLCGIAVVDTRTGARVGLFELTAGASEIYDLRFIAGRQRVNVLNTQSQEQRVAFSAPPNLHWWAVAEKDER